MIWWRQEYICICFLLFTSKSDIISPTFQNGERQITRNSNSDSYDEDDMAVNIKIMDYWDV
jgi:major membrane immunogen (membrane-anchored lipoprotein)